MKTKLILAGILACIGMSAQAQNSKVEEPKGKAIVQVFGNFHTGFGNENDNRGFELERTYFDHSIQFPRKVLGLSLYYEVFSRPIISETMFTNPIEERTKAYLTGKMG